MRVLALLGLAVLVAVSSFVPVGVAEAGDVIVVAKKGKLSLTGSRDPDVLTITLPAAGQLQVAPGAGTTVNGAAAPAIFAVTAGVNADLASGDDVLALDAISIAGDLKIKMGNGFDTFTMRDTDVAGVTRLDLGDGRGSVALCQSLLAKRLVLKGGRTNKTGAPHASCAGVESADVTTDGLAVVFGDTTVHGDLALTSKSGDATVVLANSGADGKGSIRLGHGTTLVGLCDAGIGENLLVRMSQGKDSGTLECTKGATSASVAMPHGVVLLGAQIGGSFTLNSRSQPSALAMNDSTVSQKLKLTFGGGPSSVDMKASVVGVSLVAKGGDASDTFAAENSSIGDDAKLTYGAGSNQVEIGDTSVGGDLLIKAGDGDDTILTATATVVGKRTIKPGGGTNTVTP